MLHIVAVYEANFLAGGHFYVQKQKLLPLNFENAVNIFENGVFKIVMLCLNRCRIYFISESLNATT